jgi:hypothetical protein
MEVDGVIVVPHHLIASVVRIVVTYPTRHMGREPMVVTDLQRDAIRNYASVDFL